MAFNEMLAVKKPIKAHKCIWCSEPIVIGEAHQKFFGKFEGDIQDWRTHNDCWKAITVDPGYNEDCGICNGPHARGGKCLC